MQRKHFGKVDKPSTLQRFLHEDDRGSLWSYEPPFQVARVYAINASSLTSHRGNHAHKKLQQSFICISGSFVLTLQTPDEKFTFRMDKNSDSVVVPNGYWRSLNNFEDATIVLVLASHKYEPEDYIHNFDDYSKWYREVFLS